MQQFLKSAAIPVRLARNTHHHQFSNSARQGIIRQQQQHLFSVARFQSTPVEEVSTLEDFYPAINHIFKEKCGVTVLGVGGAGCNAVDSMVRSGIQNVNFFVVNTDAQALRKTECESRIQIGVETTRGYGAGSVPQIGRKSAEESIGSIMEYVKESQILFIAAGMGGGTGTGAAPIIGAEARKLGILTVGVVTTPFHFEGAKRQRIALDGIKELEKSVDTLIIVPNENVLNVSTKGTTITEAFKITDEVLIEGVRGITDLILEPGLINLDFADLRTVMKEGGRTFMGTGFGFSDATTNKTGLMQASITDSGKMEANTTISRGKAAVLNALHNPLLDIDNLSDAKHVLLSVSGGPDLTLHEVQDIATVVKEQVNDDTNIIIGANNTLDMKDCVKVSLIVTGVPNSIPTSLKVFNETKQSVSSSGKSRSSKEQGFFSRFISKHW